MFVLVAELALTLALWAQSLPKSNTQQDYAPKREFRGAWLHIVGNSTMRTMSSKQVQDWISDSFDALQEAGCNAIVFQVRPQADAFYQSDIEPWTRYLTGTQGKAPEPLWDPLQFACEQAHARGMELHAWLNPYRVTSVATDQLAPGHLYFREPWRFVRYGKQIYFNPGRPENIEYTVKVVSDIVSRYDVDAIHFDDYFYPYPIAGQEFPDDGSFKRFGAGYDSKADWRRDNCTRLIEACNKAIKAIKPWVRFGISPFGIHRNISQDPNGSNTSGLSTYDQLYADIPLWVQEGYIDYFVPQLYWKIGHSRADYETLIRWWNERNFDEHLYIGQNIATLEEPDLLNPRTTQLEAKMKLSRDLPNVNGNVWWPGWDLAKGVSSINDSLKVRYQRTPALIPAYRRLDRTSPAPVCEFKIEGRRLEWKAEPTDDPMQQTGFFVLYRIPMAEQTDITKGRNIYVITRSNSIEIPITPWKFKYVVTVCDHCWNESEPSSELVL